MQRAISFVDSPGHETLMAVMLSGAAVMNGALLTIAANEHCPQPQTREHLKALEILGIRDIVIVQTKIDLVSGERVKENYEEIKEFIKGSIAENSVIIPVSAYYNVNIDVLMKAIIEQFSLPDYYEDRKPLTSILRSFDVNRPGTKPQKLRGGVAGGSLAQGILRIGNEIEIRPGIKKEEHNRVRWDPLYTKIVSLRSGELELESARSGGLIAIGTSLDPSLTKADGLAGQTLGKPGSLPEILNNLTLGVSLLEKVIGLEEDMPVEPIKSMEPLMLSVGSATTVGIVKSARGDVIDVNLRMPVCPMKKQRVAISRRFGSRWRLIGYGIIK